MNDYPPRPRLVLAVGIIGHRPDRLPLQQAKLDALADEVTAVLDSIGREAAAARARYVQFFSAQRPLIATISALAEGADRIAAHAAIALKRGAAAATDGSADFALEVPLPFSADTYKADFGTDESKAEFDTLLTRAQSVLVLPGERGRTDDSKKQVTLRESRSYEDVGLTLLNQSDVILAIWDGGNSAGRGGTRELLDIAARSGTPIIHIDANCEVATQLRWDGLDQFPVSSNAVDDLPVKSFSAAVPGLIDELLRPPKEKRIISEGSGDLPQQAAKQKTDFDLERQRLKQYYNERLWPWNFGVAFPWLMALFGVREPRYTDWRPLRPDELSAHLAYFDKSEPPNAKLQQTSVLAVAFGWADAWGVWLAQVFRSAVVMNFSFAAFAILAAAASLVLSDITKFLHSGEFDMNELAHHKLPFVLVELIFIFSVLGVTIAGYVRGWHHRWLEAREVAERLRIGLALWTLGLRPATFPAEEPAWTGWYTRAIVREQGIRSVVLDAAGLQQCRGTLRAVLSDQCNYHSATAARMGKMETRLEKFGGLLFLLTLLALLVYFVAVLSQIHVPARISYSVTGLAAGLPALGTATFGIRIIGDFDGIARRSERTHQMLQRIIDSIGAENPPSLNALRAWSRAASDVMLGDISSWRLAAESRTLGIPS